MTDLPLVDRDAEFTFMSAILEAIHDPRHPDASGALGVLRWEPYHVLLACADTQSVFCAWRHAQTLGHGPPPEETVARYGLVGEISACGDCLARFDDTFLQLREIGKRRLKAVTGAEAWVREPQTYDS